MTDYRYLDWCEGKAEAWDLVDTYVKVLKRMGFHNWLVGVRPKPRHVAKTYVKGYEVYATPRRQQSRKVT